MILSRSFSDFFWHKDRMPELFFSPALPSLRNQAHVGFFQHFQAHCTLRFQDVLISQSVDRQEHLERHQISKFFDSSPHCASKRKKENHQFQKKISQITLSYPNMTISYQFWLHISILVRIWLIESCSFYPKLSKNSIFT